MDGYFSNIVGNGVLRQRLGDLITQNKFPHAIIIEGEEGSGRKTLARSIAAALVCEDRKNGIPCGKCLACDKIFGGKTPDLIFVTPEEDRVSISVDAARFIKQDAIVVPNDFDYKIYVIDPADTMTPQAQNALLLTLEDPPKYAVFILICRSAASLLETVRSRAPVFRTTPVPDSELKEYLLANDKRAAKLSIEFSSEFSDVVTLARGRIGYALELLNDKRRAPIIQKRHLAEDIVKIFARPTSAAKKLEVLNTFSNKRDEAITELSLIREALRDLTLLKTAEDAPLLFWSDREEAIDLSCRFTLSSLFELSAKLEHAEELLTRGANLRLTMYDLVF